MPKFSVTVLVTYSGDITVEAKDKTEAIELARRKYKGVASLDGPCVDVDFPDDGDEDGGVELVVDD